MTYAIHVLIMVLLYGVLAMSLSVISTWSGILSLVHGGIYGVGAYTAAVLSLKLGAPPLVSLAVAVLAGVIAGSFLSIAGLRTRGEEFMLMLFAFQLILVDILKGFPSLTGGNNGLRGITPWSLPPLPFGPALSALLVALIFSAICFFLLIRVHLSPLANALRVMREDEVLCLAFGHATLTLRTKAFVLSGAMAAGVGAIYAHYTGYIDPTSFGLSQSIYILSMVILGGSSSFWAPFVGAIALVVLPESLRFAGIPNVHAGYIRQIAYGIILLVMIWRRWPEQKRVHPPPANVI
jgi:branched-chain amino acid transport system permease protein